MTVMYIIFVSSALESFCLALMKWLQRSYSFDMKGIKTEISLGYRLCVMIYRDLNPVYCHAVSEHSNIAPFNWQFMYISIL